MQDKTLNAVRRLLTTQYGPTVAVDLVERLDSPHIVLRCAVSGHDLPTSVIVKHDPIDQDDDLPNYHFRNELVNLRFLNDELDHGLLAPRLYAADADENLLVIEDFGTVETLQDTLLNGIDRSQAEQSLVNYGAYLGRFMVLLSGATHNSIRCVIHWSLSHPIVTPAWIFVPTSRYSPTCCTGST